MAHRVDDLRRFVRQVFAVLGVPEPWDDVAADVLVTASMEGREIHGLSRLPFYARRIQAGGVDPAALGEVRIIAPGLALVDGQNGLGPVIAVRAMRQALELARGRGSPGSGCTAATISALPGATPASRRKRA